MEVSKLLDTGLNSIKNVIQSNNFVYALVYLLLIVYTVQVSQNLPSQMVSLVKNSFFKLFVFVIILWTAKFDVTTSILVSLAFMLTINYLNNAPLWELLENVENVNNNVDVTIVPSSELALDKVNNEVQVETPVVNSVNDSGAVIVKPTVTESGEVQNPTILVSPVVVSTQNGETKLVIPNVQITDAPAPAPAPEPAPEPAPAPALAPALEPAPALAEQVMKQEIDNGCYPHRNVDMNLVQPYTSNKVAQLGKL